MRKFKKSISIILACVVMSTFLACGAKKETINYGNAEAFEAALNAGENLEGKIVQFKIVDIKPKSEIGFDIWAGEHLNFVSEDSKDVKKGDTMVVRATKIGSALGSWIIKYEVVDNAEKNDSTITKYKAKKKDDSPKSSSSKEKSEAKVDYEDVASFEADLNGGADLTGKTVKVSVDNLETQSAYGYNIWSGEHLNFVSVENPNVTVGEIIPVKIKSVENVLGSWIIEYEKLK